jgi:hypothetical protein
MALIASLQDDLSGRGAMSSGASMSAKDPYLKPSGPVSPMPSMPPIPESAGGGAPPMPHDMKPMSAKADLAQGMAMMAPMQTPYAQPYSPVAFSQPGFQAAGMALQTPAWSQDSCAMPQQMMSPGAQMQALQAQKVAHIQAMKAQSQAQGQPQSQMKASSKVRASQPLSTMTPSYWMMIVAWIVALIVVVLIVVGFAYIVKTHSKVNLLALAQSVSIA